jgi:hypothetical protein
VDGNKQKVDNFQTEKIGQQLENQLQRIIEDKALLRMTGNKNLKWTSLEHGEKEVPGEENGEDEEDVDNMASKEEMDLGKEEVEVKDCKPGMATGKKEKF